MFNFIVSSVKKINRHCKDSTSDVELLLQNYIMTMKDTNGIILRNENDLPGKYHEGLWNDEFSSRELL